MGGGKSIIWIIVGLVLILLFKNSMEKKDTFQFNYKTSLLSSLLFIYSLLSLNKVSEFLYFNF